MPTLHTTPCFKRARFKSPATIFCPCHTRFHFSNLLVSYWAIWFHLVELYVYKKGLRPLTTTLPPESPPLLLCLSRRRWLCKDNWTNLSFYPCEIHRYEDVDVTKLCIFLLRRKCAMNENIIEIYYCFYCNIDLHVTCVRNELTHTICFLKHCL
jgi:hypothetical protein